MSISDIFTSKYDRRIIFYGRKIANVFTVFRVNKFKGNIKQAGYKKSLFPFDMSKPAFRRKNKWYYFVDVENGQISLGDTRTVMSPKLFDLIVKKELGKQLVSVLESVPLLGNLIMMLLGIGLGVAVGYIIGNFAPMSG
jgi:hypothetical protein